MMVRRSPAAERQIVVAAHKRERHREEHAVRRDHGKAAAGEGRRLEQTEVDQRRPHRMLLPDEGCQQHYGCNDAEAEQGEAEQIHPLAPGDFGNPRKHRQNGREGENIADRDPAYFVELSIECTPKRRQGELNDAGIDLSDEGGDAGGADDKPRIIGSSQEQPGGRRFALVQHGVA